MGDRFAHQARAQIQACRLAAKEGVEIIPVWNKSNRGHTMTGSAPRGVRSAAATAIREAGWKKAWHVDADHIRLENVDRFISSSDYFTIDVADSIGKTAPAADIAAFVKRHPELIGEIEMPGITRPIQPTRVVVERAAAKFLSAAQDAGKIYRHIAKAKGAGNFITEVSMDETDSPQTPPELLVILAGMSDEKVPIQAIAPRFTGRFNHGVDFAGDLAQFEREFNEDLAVIAHAVLRYGLPESLKLSMHSGSDKFSIYPAINRAVKALEAGLHVKTAGTTWLEELIGLAEAGGDAFALAREIYCDALEHCAEICAPYARVIDIDPKKLPAKEQVARWTPGQYCAALRHDPKCKEYNPHFRQLLHAGYPIAARKGDRFLKMIEANEGIIGRNVTMNLYERHLKPIFL